MKQRAMALFIGIIMVLSTVGFAVNRTAVFSGANKNKENPLAGAFLINRTLSPEEKIYILRSGKVIIENFYTENCSTCLENKATLQTFAEKFKKYIFLENVLNNETVSLKMIGKAGEIKDVENVGNITLNESVLMDAFCPIAIIQPKECLLREI